MQYYPAQAKRLGLMKSFWDVLTWWVAGWFEQFGKSG